MSTPATTMSDGITVIGRLGPSKALWKVLFYVQNDDGH